MEKIKRLKKGEMQVLYQNAVIQVFIQRDERNKDYMAGTRITALSGIIMSCRSSGILFKNK